jgi:hypothetical protein
LVLVELEHLVAQVVIREKVVEIVFLPVSFLLAVVVEVTGSPTLEPMVLLEALEVVEARPPAQAPVLVVQEQKIKAL